MSAFWYDKPPDEMNCQLLRRRGELVERSFAHTYETGAMRRVHLRGRENVLKRLPIHVGGFNLSLAMPKLLGKGTPRGFQGLSTWPRICCGSTKSQEIRAVASSASPKRLNDSTSAESSETAPIYDWVYL